MKKSTIEKHLKKCNAKEKAKKLLQEKELKSNSKEKEKAKKLLKKDFAILQNEKEKKEIEKAKKLLQEKKKENELKKEKEKRKELNLKDFEKRIEKEIEKENWKTFESKLKNFSLYNENEKEFDLKSQFAFCSKDFFIHNSLLLKNEKEKKLIDIYNQIEWIWKWMNLNDIEKIILEGLKKRLIFEFIENFEKNLKRKNAKDIKNLNAFFLKSNLKKYLKNQKELNLNIFENDFENIFWKSENYLKKHSEKMNWKYILKEISFQEKLKAKSKTRKEKKLNWKELKEIEKKNNLIERLKKELKEKENIIWKYNLESKRIDFSINQNSFLLKMNWKIERMKRKVFERNWIELKEKELKEKKKINTENIVEFYNENDLKEIEKEKELKEKEKELKEISESIENDLKEIWKRKKEIEKKIFSLYKNQIEKIYNHWKNAKEKAYWKYLKDINNCNSKIKNIEKNLIEKYWKYAKELTWKEIQENYLKAFWKKFDWIIFEK